MGAVRILLMALAGFQLFGCVLIDWIPIRYEPLPPDARKESVARGKKNSLQGEPQEPNIRKPPSSQAVIEVKPPKPRTPSRREAESVSGEEAVEVDRGLAATGDPEAQYSLGRLYLSGEGVERDYARATDLFVASAQQGHAGAQRALGHMYENGLGTSPSPKEAAKWYALAAGQGDIQAMAALGYLAFTGFGIPQDSEAGIRWLRMAGERGNIEAQMLLGAIYDTGWTITEDDAEALRWYTLAAEGGDPLARFMQGCMHALGESVPFDIVSAAKDYRMAADLGVEEAEAVLGNRYVNLSGDDSMLKWKQSLIQKGPRYARDHLEKFLRLVETYKGAALGDADAMFGIGSFYWRGEGFEKDFDQAVRWWRLAARLGNKKARGFLARIDDFEKNGASEKETPMTRVGEKKLPAGLVYQIGFDLLDERRGDGEIRPSSAWVNMLRSSRGPVGGRDYIPRFHPGGLEGIRNVPH